MSENPYQTPAGGPGGAPQKPSGLALERVKPFAITLMIVMGLCMVLQVIGLLMNVLGVGANAAAGGDQAMQGMMSGTVGIISSLAGLAVGGFIIFAMTKAMNGESHMLVMIATVLAMLPFLSPCCCLGLPIGIWGLVILNDAEVKQAFTS